MPRPIHATIHSSALHHNLQRIQQAAGSARIWAVVKANAYGHGISRVFESLRGADGFALLDLSEAQTLRNLDWRGPILLLEGAFEARDLEWCSRLNLWHVVHNEQQIDWLAAHKTHEGHRVFLKMNTGMNRLGFKPDHYRSALARLQALPQVTEVSHMTHFSDADALDATLTRTQQQTALFERTTADLSGESSLCNSAALLRQVASGRNDWMRSGIALYGASPNHMQQSAQDWGLQPVMSLHSRLIAVQELSAGETVGYGSGFTAPQAMRIGVVACGYADGYPRLAPAGTPVLVDGVRCTLAGRVSMDMLTLDLSAAPEADLDSEVTLWGCASNGALLAVDEVAVCAQTIGYELLCALAPRVPFEMKD